MRARIHIYTIYRVVYIISLARAKRYNTTQRAEVPAFAAAARAERAQARVIASSLQKDVGQGQQLATGALRYPVSTTSVGCVLSPIGYPPEFVVFVRLFPCRPFEHSGTNLTVLRPEYACVQVERGDGSILAFRWAQQRFQVQVPDQERRHPPAPAALMPVSRPGSCFFREDHLLMLC